MERGVSDHIRIRSGNSAATIDPLGAEVIDWQVDGRPLLWSADPVIWRRTAPLLFPIVGRARGGHLSISGRDYPIGVHGFAADSSFTVLETRPDEAALELRDNDATREAFPFGFRLVVSYRVGENTLEVSLRIENSDASALPYAVGWHPGFAVPFSAGARQEHRVEFEHEERPDVPVITPDGLFSDRRRTLPLCGRGLAMTDEVLEAEALCFLNARSRSVRLVAPDGAAIRMSLEDFPHLALWSRPGAPFLSIEAWTGHGDPDGFAGDIWEKPSMRRLEAGSAAEHRVSVVREGTAP